MNALAESTWLVIGAGRIGTILLRRLLAAGVPASRLTVNDIDGSQANAAATALGIRVASLDERAISGSDAVLVATPPPEVLEVLGTVREWLRKGQAIISFAAGVPLALLEQRVPEGVAVARVMPNAPSLVGRGMNPVVYATQAPPESRALVEALLAVLGGSIIVDDSQMNACVGLTGAAMRSVLPVLEGMTRAGVEAGLFEKDARRVAAAVVAGSAALVSETELGFEEMRSLTPMRTLDEELLSRLIYEAALGATEKARTLERTIVEKVGRC